MPKLSGKKVFALVCFLAPIFAIFILPFLPVTKDILNLQVYARHLEPANPNASSEARQILDWLASLPERNDSRVIPGQFIGLTGDLTGAYNSYMKSTGKTPGLVSNDWGINQNPADWLYNIKLANQTLINHWDNNGFVSVSFHANNPWTGGLYTDRTGRNLTDLITPGTAVNTVWMQQLDTIAAGLADLQDHGVVVFWRPFHEMTWLNGFWWTQSSLAEDTQPFINMWKHMFNYFTYQKGLNNLLWVYGTADYHDGVPVTHLYPGNDYVDIVGISLYSDNAILMRGAGGYPAFLATGKPFAFTEYGPHPPPYDNPLDNMTTVNSIKTNYPEAVWFLHWNDYFGSIGIKDYSNAETMLNDPWVLTQGELDWGSSPSSCPADINHDNTVNVADIIVVLQAWGNCSGCREDVDGNGIVNVTDIIVVLQAWGSCD